MYSGLPTVTGAGAFGPLLLIAALLFRAAPRAIIEAGMETLVVAGSIFLRIMGAEILSSIPTLSGLARGFADWVSAAGFGRIAVVAAVLLILFPETMTLR